jgi:two-component system, response regulator PdtaR
VTTANVVIVEDEFLVALQLEDILLELDYRVVGTLPDKASADALAYSADVALVDLNLRDGPTGPAIARSLSERFGTRIIYVTANSGQIGIPADTALGVVHKPFSRDTIEAAVAYALDETLTVPRPAELQPLEGHGMRQTA